MLRLISSETVLRCSGAVAICWLLTGRQGEVPTGIAKQARLQGLIAVTRRQQQEYIAALNWVPPPDCQGMARGRNAKHRVGEHMNRANSWQAGPL